MAGMSHVIPSPAHMKVQVQRQDSGGQGGRGISSSVRHGEGNCNEGEGPRPRDVGRYLRGARSYDTGSRSICWPCQRRSVEQIGKKPGDTVEVVVWKDDELRTLEVPAVRGTNGAGEAAAVLREARALPTAEGILPIDR